VYGPTSAQAGTYGCVGLCVGAGIVWLLVSGLGAAMSSDSSVGIYYLFAGILLVGITGGIGRIMAKNKYREQITFFRRYRF